MYAELILKKCSDCSLDKKREDFYKRKASLDGLSYICKKCDSDNATKYRIDNRVTVRKQQKAWRDNNKEQVAAVKRKSKFGLSVEEQNTMLESQNHKCAICGKPQAECTRRLAIDHDHVTKAIRGMLCDNCNRGIGLLQDNLSILENAVSYMKKHQK